MSWKLSKFKEGLIKISLGFHFERSKKKIMVLNLVTIRKKNKDDHREFHEGFRCFLTQLRVTMTLNQIVERQLNRAWGRS